MKARYSIIISLLIGIFLITGCADEKPQKAIETLNEELKEIDKLVERSENIENENDAFTLVRDLNKSMKDVRDAVLSMDSEYAELKNESQREKVKAQFAEANKKLDEKLQKISKNVEPFKDKPRVKQIMGKFHEVLISK